MPKNKKPKKINITKDMTFEEIILRYPKSIDILLKRGMHCAGCHAAPIETLEQGARVHGIDPDKLLKELKTKLARKKK